MHRDADVAARVSLTQLAQFPVVCLRELARRRANGELEHLHAGGEIGQADVDSALETATDGCVELPGDVRCAEDEHAARVLAYTVHLHEKLGLDAARRFGFAFATGAAEGVDFVDEDDGGLVFACHVEQLFYQSTTPQSLSVA